MAGDRRLATVSERAFGEAVACTTVTDHASAVKRSRTGKQLQNY